MGWEILRPPYWLLEYLLLERRGGLWYDGTLSIGALKERRGVRSETTVRTEGECVGSPLEVYKTSAAL